jgi:hypothetical protein
MINCEGCGAHCCKLINCKHLKDDKCSIYGSRPSICNTDEVYDKLYSKFISREEYDKKSAEVCKMLQKHVSNGFAKEAESIRLLIELEKNASPERIAKRQILKDVKQIVGNDWAMAKHPHVQRFVQELKRIKGIK